MWNILLRILGGNTSSPKRPNTAHQQRPPTGRAGSSAVPAPTVRDALQRATRPGTLTGYEPKHLRGYHAPVSLNAHGVAGLGLFDADFANHNIYSGQRGEVGFYKALCLSNLIDSASSFWSVAMPGDRGRPVADTQFTTDVDCIIVQGNVIYLIDLKYYASGDVTWHSSDQTWLMCRDNATGKQVGKPRKMSRNMAMAQERFPRIFPRHRVLSYVVLIPTNAGVGQVAPGTAWPGGIPLITLPEMLTILQQAPPALADPATVSALSGLVQD